MLWRGEPPAPSLVSSEEKPLDSNVPPFLCRGGGVNVVASLFPARGTIAMAPNIFERYHEFEEDAARVFTYEDVEKKRAEAKAGDAEAAYWLSACLVGFSLHKRPDIVAYGNTELTGRYELQPDEITDEMKLKWQETLERYVCGSLESATEAELDEEMRHWLKVAVKLGHAKACVVYANAYVSGERTVEVIPGMRTIHYSYDKHRQVETNRYMCRKDDDSREAFYDAMFRSLAENFVVGEIAFMLEIAGQNRERTEDDEFEGPYELSFRALMCVSGMYGVARNLERAERICMRLAETDDPHVLYKVALIMFDVPSMTRFAYECLKKSVALGSRSAERLILNFQLSCRMPGFGVCDSRACSIAPPFRLNIFGTFLEEGVTEYGQDISQAAGWYRMAMALGSADSAYKLARFYSSGAGVDQCWKTCAQYLSRGVLMIRPNAVVRHEKAMKSFLNAVAGNYLRGNAGLRIEKDIRRALGMYKACAKSGDADAIRALGGSNPSCAQCGAPEPKRCCEDCLETKYCNQKCQKKHWKKGDPPHRLHCAGRFPPPELKPYDPPISKPTPAPLTCCCGCR